MRKDKGSRQAEYLLSVRRHKELDLDIHEGLSSIALCSHDVMWCCCRSVMIRAKQNGSVKVDLRRIIDGRNKAPFHPRIDLISTAKTLFDLTLLRRIAYEVVCRQ